MHLSSADFFFHNITFSKIAFRNTIRMSKLEPDQANHFVGPDLGPNCLQRLSTDDTIVFPGLKLPPFLLIIL